MIIKHRVTGATLFEGDFPSVKACVTAASAARANLSGADLSGADLSWANLSGADLSGASLFRADLSGADLSRADLSGAYLSRADLFRAYLSGAYLSGANLSGADLFRANLSGADLSRANLSGANLSGANLSGAKGDPIWPHFQIPEGDLIGWKKCHNGVIAKLLIPAPAKRTASLVGRKCRAEYAVVLELSDGAPFAESMYDGKTRYVVGQEVRPDIYNPDPKIECAGGIHFFCTRAEAEEY